MSVFQYGIPQSDKLSPAEICLRKTGHLVSTSPLQTMVLLRCCPAKAERVSIGTRLSLVVCLWCWETPPVRINGKAVPARRNVPKEVGASKSLSFGKTCSGSVASSHHPRSEEHTSELHSPHHLVYPLL